MTLKPEAVAVRVSEAARLLGMTEPAIRHMIQDRTIPVMRIGARVFVEMDAINALLRSRITAPTR